MADGCPSSDLLGRYLEGNLASGQQRRLEAHLAACASCREAAFDASGLTAHAYGPAPDELLEAALGSIPRWKAAGPMGRRRPLRSLSLWASAAAAVVLAAVGGLVFMGGRAPAPRSQEPPTPVQVGLIAHADGVVSVRSGDGTGPTRVTCGTPLRSGEVLEAVGGTARVDFADVGSVFVRGVNRLEVRERKDGLEIHVPTGELYCEVEPKHPGRTFRVVAPHATVEAMGTQFLVQAMSSGTRVAVFSGRVQAVSGRGHVLLGSGEAVEVRQDAVVAGSESEARKNLGWAVSLLDEPESPVPDSADPAGRDALRYNGTVKFVCPLGRMIVLATDRGDEMQFIVAPRIQEEVMTLPRGAEVVARWVRCPKMGKAVMVGVEK